jgi:hypothetical protein
MERQTNSLTNVPAWLYVLQQRNLVYNYDFTLFSNQETNGGTFEYGHPDGWMYTEKGTNGSIGFNTLSNTCKILTANTQTAMSFAQALHEFPRAEVYLQGELVSACMELSVSAECTVTLQLNDGQDATAKMLTMSGSMVLEVSHMVSSNATELVLTLFCNTPGITLNISKAYANRGTFALENLPCMVEGVIGERRQYIATQTAPPTELSLCEISRELTPDHTRLSSVLNGRFGVGSGGNSMLPDMRGYFSRAWNHDADIDPNAAQRSALGDGTVTGDFPGTVEEDCFKSHTHLLGFNKGEAISMGPTPNPTALYIFADPNGATQAEGGDETRGKNISELYTIKWA